MVTVTSDLQAIRSSNQKHCTWHMLQVICAITFKKDLINLGTIRARQTYRCLVCKWTETKTQPTETKEQTWINLENSWDFSMKQRRHSAPIQEA